MREAEAVEEVPLDPVPRGRGRGRGTGRGKGRGRGTGKAKVRPPIWYKQFCVTRGLEESDTSRTIITPDNLNTSGPRVQPTGTSTPSLAGQTTQAVVADLTTPSSSNTTSIVDPPGPQVVMSSSLRSPPYGAKWFTISIQEHEMNQNPSTSAVKPNTQLAPSATSSARKTKGAQKYSRKSGTGTQEMGAQTQSVCTWKPKAKAGPNEGYADPEEKTCSACSSKQESASSRYRSPESSPTTVLSAIKKRSTRTQYFSTVASFAQPQEMHLPSGVISVSPITGLESRRGQEEGSQLTAKQIREAFLQRSSLGDRSSPLPATAVPAFDTFPTPRTSPYLMPSTSRTTYYCTSSDDDDMYLISPTGNRLRSSTPRRISGIRGYRYNRTLGLNRPFMNNSPSSSSSSSRSRRSCNRDRKSSSDESPFLHPDSQEVIEISSSRGSTTLSIRSSPSIVDLRDDETCDLPTPIVIDSESSEEYQGVTVKKKPSPKRVPTKKPKRSRKPKKPKKPKKPRNARKSKKQKLNGDDQNEEDDWLTSKRKSKKKAVRPSKGPKTSESSSPNLPPNNKTEPKPKATPSPSNSRRHIWKPAMNHYLEYTDVKPTPARPTLKEIANEKNILQRLEGWKLYHLSTQMDELAELESQVYDKLGTALKEFEGQETGEQAGEVSQINELIKENESSAVREKKMKGNMQRAKLVNEGLGEAKSQMMKVFEHKAPVAEILTRVQNRRNPLKRTTLDT